MLSSSLWDATLIYALKTAESLWFGPEGLRQHLLAEKVKVVPEVSIESSSP